MKSKKYKNIVCLFFTAALLSLIFLCLSCSNLFSPKTAGNNADAGSSGSENLFGNAKYTVSGNIALRGALPAELTSEVAGNSEISGNSKSAAPSMPALSSIRYVLDFTNSSDSTNNETVHLEAGKTSFSVELNKGTYELTVSGYDSSDKKILEGKRSSSFTLSDTNKKLESLAVSVAPVSTGSGTGTVYLTLNLTGSGIQSYKAVWTENGTEKVTNFNAGGVELPNPVFCMIEGNGKYPDDAPQAVGLYEVHFTFYNSLTQDGSTEVFSCTEYINVFENLQTDTWVNDANTSYISGGSFTLTQDIIANHRHHKFYVDQMKGTGTNEGSYFKPLDSVEAALSKIYAYNDGAPYKIILLSDVEEDSDEASYTYDASNGQFGSYIEITPSSALNLTIEGYGTEKRTINANRSPSNTGSVFYINENANVTLDNLLITGAYSEDLYGGGICNAGELHIKNCDVTGNTADYGGAIALKEGSPELYFENTQQIKIKGNDARTGGGGLYFRRGTVSFDNTDEILISENSCTGSGGGILSYISMDIPVSSKVTVSQNESYNGNGSGIWFYSSSGTLNLSSAVNIENNTAAESGGGIYLSSGTLNIDGATVSGNSAGTGGGGVYSRDVFNFKSGKIVDNECTGDAAEGGGIYNGSELFIGIDGNENETCLISGNNAKSGGGIFNSPVSSFKMSCGTVSKNSAGEYGAGIFTKAEFTISKALITENKADADGGAIYVNSTSINTITLGEDVFFTKNQANTGSVIYSTCPIMNLNLKCTFDDDGDNIFDDAEKNTSATDGYLMKFAGTSGTTKLSFYSTFNMSDENSIYIVTDEDDAGKTAQIFIAESLAKFSESKKIKIVPSLYPADSAGIQVFSADSSLSAADEYAKFSIADDSSNNAYSISNEGKIVPAVATTVYTDWEALTEAVLAIPEATSEVTDFEIGGNMSITSELLSDKPIRLFAQNSYTLTLDTAATTPVFSPEAAITIEGVGEAKITFDGNTVTATDSFISLDKTTAATFKNVNFKNFYASTDGAVVSAASSNCDATFTNCGFISNKAAAGDGGAVCIATSASFTFNDCIFGSNSSAAGSGGALAIENKDAAVIMNSCTFTGNHADSDNQGGGIYVFKGECIINGITMASNTTGTSSINNDIFLNVASSFAELRLCNTCKIPVVYSSLGGSSSASPNIIKIEAFESSSSVGIQMSLYSYDLTKDVIQDYNGTPDISSFLGCFFAVDSAYTIKANADGTGFYIQSN